MVALYTFLCLWLATANPFANKRFYVNPTFRANIDSTIASVAASDPRRATIVSNLQIARNAPSAYWLDVQAKVQLDSMGLDTMNGILADASSHADPPMVVFIVYDLPNRDCNAKASNGEICCTPGANGRCDYLAGGDCAGGLAVYKRYIDNIATIATKWAQVPMAFVIEPDSFPNLVTNLGNPACGVATQASYRNGITYAIDTLVAAVPQFPLYVDIAHGGWLGWWENNAQQAAAMLKSWGIMPKVRGFATNVANYQPLGRACPEALWCLPHNNHLSDPCCADPCGLTNEYNPANSELNYVMQLRTLFPDKFFLIDTGRSGVPGARQSCKNWCNPRNTGLGQFPTTATALPYIDAYFWLKTPGETDGCTQMLPTGTQCPRFDSMCGSSDSIGSEANEPRMPEAGHWSDYQMRMLAVNANFGTMPSLPPSPSPVPAPQPTPTPAPTPSPQPQPSPTPTPQSITLKKCQLMKPSLSDAVLNSKMAAHYASWKNLYLKSYKNGVYAQFTTGSRASVSEGQGFLMIIAAMLQDAAVFEKATNYYLQFRNPTTKQMYWRQTIAGADLVTETGDKTSATDGDVDIIYALYIAGRQWNNANYINLAMEALDGFKKHVVNSDLKSLKLGDWSVSNTDAFGRTTRSSDFMLGHIQAFGLMDPSYDWGAVFNSIVNTALTVHKDSSAATGLLPDFIVHIGGKWQLPTGRVLEAETDNHYSWNACRLFMRLAPAYCAGPNAALLPMIKTANAFIKSNSGGQPNNIKAVYTMSGVPTGQYTSLAFQAPFMNAAQIAGDQAWLNTLFNYVDAKGAEGYYADSIKLVSLLLATNNYQYPSLTSGPAPQPQPLPAPVPSPAPQPQPQPSPVPTPVPTPVPAPVPTPVPTPKQQWQCKKCVKVA